VLDEVIVGQQMIYLREKVKIRQKLYALVGRKACYGPNRVMDA